MKMISKQVKELRELSNEIDEDKVGKFYGLHLEMALDKAANTIEALSAKLVFASMERPDMVNRNKLIEEIDKEINGVIIKDTYSKGKNAGLRKAKILVEEQTETHYGGGWISCEDRLPEEHDSMFAKLKGTAKWNDAMFEKTSDNVNATVEFENGQRKTMTLHTVDGKWKRDSIVKFEVVAWQPLPEPYKAE